jgi:hypothetical protein
MPDSAVGEVYHFDSAGENLQKFIPLDSNLPYSFLDALDLKDLEHKKITLNPCTQVSRTEGDLCILLLAFIFCQYLSLYHLTDT